MSIHFVIPYYGDPGYLIDAVDSVRTQTVTDWELTVVDDGYPGRVVADHLASLGDSRIEYLRNLERLGPNGNTYKCSRLGRRELLCTMNADDLLEPNYVEIVSGHFRDPSVVAVQPGVTVIDENGGAGDSLADRVKRVISARARSRGSIEGEAGVRSLLAGNWLYTPSLTYRAAAVTDIPFHEGIDAIHDLAFVVDLLLDGGRIAIDPTPAFRYRRHGASDSSTRARDGRRYDQEQRYFREIASQLRLRGWTRAARAAELHVFSRLHALKVAVDMAAARDLASARAMVGRMLS
ncbi:glycosyltransferase family 2 protein [Pseudonocardia hispaniensis]|uniref:Glycosyltransferase family 2 protein n=1 Tax=Pseudonocardia hispaniensis TaxID=904933 RepID=A0ABW1J5S1_9PSEU